MLLVDKPFLDTLLYCVRQMTWHLQNEGAFHGRKAHPAADALYAVDASN